MGDVFTVFAVVSSFIGGGGVILNFLVCFLYFTTPKLLDAPNIFILNMAIGDFTYSVVALPLLVASNVRGEWIFGEAACTAYAFITTFCALGSIMHLAAAAYERYFTICRLFNDGQTQFSKKKAIILSVLVWSYSLFWSLMPVLGWSRFVLEGIRTSCSVDWTSREPSDVSYTVCLMLACFVLPVTVMCTCYHKTYKALKALSEMALQNWGENNRITQDTLQAENKMVSIIVAITIGFLVAWTPYALVSMVAIVNPSIVSDIGATIPAFFAKSSACYNPIIYVFMYKKMRNRLVTIFCCKSGQVHPGGPDDSEMASYRQSGAKSRHRQTPSGVNSDLHHTV